MGNDLIPFIRKAGRAPGLSGRARERSPSTGIGSPARPARSQSLYRLSCLGPHSILILLLTYLLTYSMVQSPSWEANWFAASQEIPSIYGTRRFITALTSVRHLSLSWASPNQSTYPHPTSWRSILILSIHLRLCLPSGLFPSGFPTKTLYLILLLNIISEFHLNNVWKSVCTLTENT